MDIEFEIIEKERKKTGIVDGPEYFLSCVACDAKLIHLKVVYPDAPAIWQVYATCPCGEQSELMEVHGEFKQMPCDGYTINDVRFNNNTFKYEMSKQQCQ